MDTEEAWHILEEADCLYTQEEVEASVSKIAIRIINKCAKENPIAVSILNGGAILFGQLLPKLDFPLETDYIHATRYKDNKAVDELKWIARPTVNPSGRSVILIDDILDEGVTLSGIIDYYQKAGANKVVTVVLVAKERKRKIDIKADVEGFRVPDRYVFGYGMDYKGYWRNAPGIYTEKER